MKTNMFDALIIKLCGGLGLRALDFQPTGPRYELRSIKFCLGKQEISMEPHISYSRHISLDLVNELYL